MSLVKIRLIEKDDIAKIAECEAEIFSDASSAKAIERLFDSGAIGVCAYCENIFCGYAYCADAAGDAELLRVAVLPEHRKRRVASVLLQEMHRILRERNFSCIYLEVRESNLAARALYLSLGYSEEGRRRNFYSNPREDAILMRKDLRSLETE